MKLRIKPNVSIVSLKTRVVKNPVFIKPPWILFLFFHSDPGLLGDSWAKPAPSSYTTTAAVGNCARGAVAGNELDDQ